MHHFNCDCGKELELLELGEVLDEYEDKKLVECRYYCPCCCNEYVINVELDKDFY